MSIRKIAKLGHPILRQKAQLVSLADLKTNEIKRLIQDMLETVIDADGAGLAAPQVHVSKRIVLLDIEEFEGFQIWINPTIRPLSEEHMVTFEGCLSVPGMRGAVARPDHIQVSGLYPDGTTFDIELEGYSAIVAQHECDHLDGILYIDRADPRGLAFISEYKKYSSIIMDSLFLEEE
ncbi:MAG: peptide deformylase [Myxococcota bacterium]|nr:peptide deformylase [Myxococcota bacterium]